MRGMAVFLSTPSARRATFFRLCWICSHRISIHALREEGDAAALPALPLSAGFLSTPSARRATGAARVQLYKDKISIHALREEGDTAREQPYQNTTGISIHALREEGDTSNTDSCRMGHISIHALREEGDFIRYSAHASW